MKYYLIVVAGVFACSISQIFLKKSATEEHGSKLAVMLNWKTIIAYSIMFVTLVANIYAMKMGVLLKEMAVLESLGFIFVPVLSKFFLSEKIRTNSIIAVLFVVLGIVVFYV